MKSPVPFDNAKKPKKLYYMDMKKPIFIMLGALAVYIGGLYIFAHRYHFNIFTARVNSAEIIDVSTTQNGKFNPLPLVSPISQKTNTEVKSSPKPLQQEGVPSQINTEENSEIPLPTTGDLTENLTAAPEELSPAAELQPQEGELVSSSSAPVETLPPQEQSVSSIAAEPEASPAEEQNAAVPAPVAKEAEAPSAAKDLDNTPKTSKTRRKKIIELPQKTQGGEGEAFVYIEPVTAPVKKAASKKKTAAPKKEVVKKVEVKAAETEQKPEESTGPQTLSEADLVDVMTLPVKPFLDMRYATSDNFMGEKLYPASKCYLKRNTANALMRALMYASEAEVPFSLCVYDCYRPLSIQKRMWAKMPNTGYVASPSTGSNHNRGTAVDLGPCNLEGNPLPAPTDFDEFIPAAASDAGSNIVAPAALKNREALQEIMRKAGFSTIKKEWWHFDFRGAENYPVLDIPFDKP